MIKINLLPKELQEKGKGQDWIILGYAVFGLFFLLASSSYLIKYRGYKKDLMRKDRWSQQLGSIKAKVGQVEQLDAQKNLLNAKRNTVIQLFQTRLIYPRMMQTFYENLPGEIWVKDISISEDQNRNIQIIALCSSLTTDGIADWLQILESKPERFTNIVLSAIEARPSQDARQTTYDFSMTFTYIPPPQATGT